jgi:hypothetical protein
MIMNKQQVDSEEIKKLERILSFSDPKQPIASGGVKRDPKSKYEVNSTVQGGIRRTTVSLKKQRQPTKLEELESIIEAGQGPRI